MNEAEWMDCTDLERMLTFLRSKASNRKLRLFACGCCRRLWPFLTDARSRVAVEVSERYADGLCGKDELYDARNTARAVGERGPR